MLYTHIASIAIVICKHIDTKLGKQRDGRENPAVGAICFPHS